MAKNNDISGLPRSTVYIVVAIAVLLATGMAAITHADDDKNRKDRSEREHRSIINFWSRFTSWNDVKVRAVGDMVHVNGATVTDTSSSGFTASSSAPALALVVRTDSDTKFNIKGKGSGSLSDIAVGDTVNFRGTLISGTTTSTWTINASHVEDKTQKPKSPKPVGLTTLRGTVQSVSTTVNSFVLSGSGGTTTITLASSTTLKNDDGDSIALSNITVGSNAKAIGTLSTSTNVLAATHVVVDIDDNDNDDDDDNDDDFPRRPDLSNVIARLQALIDWLRNLSR